MTLLEDSIFINYKFCSTCTQCVAVCPEQALSWDSVPPLAYDEARLPSSQQLGELFKERRTTRDFKSDKIDRGLLQEIVGYSTHAPTHNFNLRAIVVDDGEIIALIDKVLMRFTRRLYNFIYKPKIVYSLVRVLTPSLEPEYLRAKPKLESAMKRGRTFRSPPAAVVLIVGDKRIPLSEASAQYALYNMILFAQTKGVGSHNLVGNQRLLNRSRTLRKRLRLKNHERIFGTLGLGYPSVRLRNKVVGKKLEIQRNTG